MQLLSNVGVDGKSGDRTQVGHIQSLWCYLCTTVPALKTKLNESAVVSQKIPGATIGKHRHLLGAKERALQLLSELIGNERALAARVEQNPG